MKWLIRIIQALLAVSFIDAGYVKLIGNAQQIQQFKGFGYSIGFMYFIGVCEVLGGIGLLVGYWKKNLATLASACLVILMAGAAFSHIHAGENFKTAIASLVLLVLCLVVIAWNLTKTQKEQYIYR